MPSRRAWRRIGPIPPAAADDQPGPGVVAGHGGEGAKQRAEPFERVVVGGQEDRDVPVVQPQAAAEVVAGRPRIGQDVRRVEPVVDHRDPLGRNTVAAAEMLGDHPAGRDHVRGVAALELPPGDPAEDPLLEVDRLGEPPPSADPGVAESPAAALQRGRLAPPTARQAC